MGGWADVDRWRDGVAAVVGRGEPAGAAFLTHGLLLTCAHVLVGAGWSPARPQEPVQIRVRRPAGGYHFVAARVVPGCLDLDADVAVLRPAEPLPDQVVELPLAPAAGAAGRLVATFGFPQGYRDGLRGQARVLGLIPHRGRERLQLRSTEVTGGFSGGPLWDPVRQAVIGLVHSGARADQMGRLPFTTFGVPTEVLLRLCDRLSPIPGGAPVTLVREPDAEREPAAAEALIARLAGEDFPESVARRVRRDPERWHEIGRQAGVRVAQNAPFAAWSLAEALCFREPGAPDVVRGDLWGALVAAQVVVETADLGQVGRRHLSRLERLRRWLLHIMGGETLPAPRRAEAGRLLASLGDPRPGVMNVDRMEFCLVPRGSFLLGSGADDRLAYPEERPQRRAEIAYDYWLGRFPVTRSHFEAFVADGGYEEPALWPEARAQGRWEGGAVLDRDGGRRSGPVAYGTPYDVANHPVVGVTWYEAAAFARWLAGRWGRSGRLPPGWHIRLPSEAEWEKGARGGMLLPLRPRVATPTPLLLTHTPPSPRRPNSDPGRIYPWGAAPYDGSQANGQAAGIGATSAVGCFGAFPGPLGCEELVGNVLEWTRSPWRDEEREASPSPPGAGGKAARFSYFGSHEKWLRCAARGGLFPYGRDANIGFRVAIVPASAG